jgi:hypothetical protein
MRAGLRGGEEEEEYCLGWRIWENTDTWESQFGRDGRLGFDCLDTTFPFARFILDIYHNIPRNNSYS